MLFESHRDAIFDVLPARGPPNLFALRLRLAGNGRLFDSNLLKFGWREFDSLGDAIAHEFAARRPPDLFLLGLRPARSGGLGVFAASAGVGMNAVPATTTVAMMPAYIAAAKLCMITLPRDGGF
jgi:hypothetical protein